MVWHENMNKKCLVLTANEECWDPSADLIFLGQWCVPTLREERWLSGKKYEFLESPWPTAETRREAGEYCYRLYGGLLKELTISMNRIHQMSFPECYWRILLGPWLIHFIEICYDRYVRLKMADKKFSEWFAYALPKDESCRAPYRTFDFLTQLVNIHLADELNWDLMSQFLHEISPDRVTVKSISERAINPFRENRVSSKGRLKGKIKYFFTKGNKRGRVVLSDLYTLSLTDKILLFFKSGREIHWLDAEPTVEFSSTYDEKSRGQLLTPRRQNDFVDLLKKIMPRYLPRVFMEDYSRYRREALNGCDIEKVRAVGSDVGWLQNEKLKFVAAEAKSRGAVTAEFQHGAGFDQYFYSTAEKISFEKDVFYSWGWAGQNDAKFRNLPSVHLSSIRPYRTRARQKILFVGVGYPQYHFRFITWLFPEDIPGYFRDKQVFFNACHKTVLENIYYRAYEGGHWAEEERIKARSPGMHFLKGGSLKSKMSDFKLAVIDHPSTSMAEALTMNIPAVFYWNHDVYKMKSAAEKYFEKLREAGIVFRTPEEAAKVVNRVAADPWAWWSDGKIQSARRSFCEKYGLTDRNWRSRWVNEFLRLSLEPGRTE